MTIKNIWFESVNDNELLIMIQSLNGCIYSLANIEYKNHQKKSDKTIYNFCLGVAEDMGYKLATRKDLKQ